MSFCKFLYQVGKGDGDELLASKGYPEKSGDSVLGESITGDRRSSVIGQRIKRSSDRSERCGRTVVHWIAPLIARGYDIVES